MELKQQVHEFWDAAACGELAYAKGGTFREQVESQAKTRYHLEPYIERFAKFYDADSKDFLEIGVGMGADHERFVRANPKRACGVDLTERAIEITRHRLAQSGLISQLQKADAENLPFPDASFDLVYSWGVLHHTPDTARAFREVGRVLRPGGVARIMIYHIWSLVGLMLWTRYTIKTRRVLPMRQVYSDYMESPGTKAYTVEEAYRLCDQAKLRSPVISVQLSHGDLLEGEVGQRHGGYLLAIAKRVWPRAIVRTIAKPLGLYLFIEVTR